MALLSKFNSKIKDDIHTGFGSNAFNYGGRFLKKDGTPNIKKTGVNFLERFSRFHSLLSFSRTKFFLILGFYITINLLFTLIYYAMGTQHLAGLVVHSEKERFYEAFFFQHTNGARFIPMFHKDDANHITILDLKKISTFEKINLPERDSISKILPLL